MVTTSTRWSLAGVCAAAFHLPAAHAEEDEDIWGSSGAVSLGREEEPPGPVEKERIDVKELEQGPPIEAPVAIRVAGENLDVLRNLASDVEEIISSNPGTINIDNPLETSKMDLHVNIKRRKAGMLGIQLLDIDRTVRTCVAGMSISQYRDAEGEEYDIVLRLPVDKKTSVSDFGRIYLTSLTGAQIPLTQVASFEFRPSDQEITHYNLDRSVTITADVLGDYSVSKVTKEIVSRLDDYNWPEAHGYSVGGEAQGREESFGGMGNFGESQVSGRLWPKRSTNIGDRPDE